EVVSSLTARRLLYQVDRADGFTGKTAEVHRPIGLAGAAEVVQVDIVLVLGGPVGIGAVREGELQASMLRPSPILLHEVEPVAVLNHVAALQPRDRRKSGYRILTAVGAGRAAAQ